MRHPLGGNWMTYSEAKKYHGWKTPFIYLYAILSFLVMIIIGLLVLVIGSPLLLFDKLVDGYYSLFQKGRD